MKTCPICKAKCFNDMEICYGCMYNFTQIEACRLLPSDSPKSQVVTGVKGTEEETCRFAIPASGIRSAVPREPSKDNKETSPLDFPPPHANERQILAEEAGDLDKGAGRGRKNAQGTENEKRSEKEEDEGPDSLKEMNVQCREGGMQGSATPLAIFNEDISDGNIIECQLCVRFELLEGKIVSKKERD